MTKLLKNVPILDGGGRGATTSFTQRDIGDVLVTFENEAILIGNELGADKFEIVYPSTSVEAAPPAAVVDTVVDKRGTRKVAEAYLNYLFTGPAQEIIAKHSFRPRDEAVLAQERLEIPEDRNFMSRSYPALERGAEDAFQLGRRLPSDRRAERAVDQLRGKRRIRESRR